MTTAFRSALLFTALLSTQASAVEFSFLSGNPAPENFGNVFSQTVEGITATATAWSTTGNHGRYQTAELEVYNGWGMGVCNRDEGVNCSDTNMMHALDNKGADDLVLFRFSQLVSLGSLSLRQYGVNYNTQGDSDLSVWAGVGVINPDGLKPSGLGTAITINRNVPNGTYAVPLSALIGNYDWLAVSARIAHDNDFLKLRSLTVTPTTPVPEPETYAMLLVGLGLVAYAARRRLGPTGA